MASTVAHDSLRYINILTYLLTYLLIYKLPSGSSVAKRFVHS